jgi:hypothetical protein
MPKDSLAVVVASHPFCWVCLPFDRHHITDSILLSLYGSLATIILRVLPSARYLFLHNALLLFCRGLLLKFLAVHGLVRIFVRCYLCPSCIDVLRSIDSHMHGLLGSSSAKWYILVAQYLCSSTR